MRNEKAISPEERSRRLLSIVGIGSSGVDDLSVNHDAYLVEIYAETAATIDDKPIYSQQVD